MQAACPYCNGPVVAKSKMSTAGVVVLLAGLLLAPMLVGIPLIIAAFYMKENYHVCSSCGMRLAELAPVHVAGTERRTRECSNDSDQHGIGRCPTCGGGLMGYAKCPHCASDVFWAGNVPMRTAQEAADEQDRQERLAREEQERERERAERLAAQRQRQHREELERQREAQRQWEEQNVRLGVDGESEAGWCSLGLFPRQGTYCEWRTGLCAGWRAVGEKRRAGQRLYQSRLGYEKQTVFCGAGRTDYGPWMKRERAGACECFWRFCLSRWLPPALWR